ncbi:hypothetical protein ABT095_15840 [Kitasatospora sp. NPDC002227]|uniref:hypothetical protein n=1 Tax=Kitasatospora sp. NPDC002227 TaxID=3154773 RepID=UPI00332E2090
MSWNAADLLGGTEIVVPVLVFLAVSLQKWKSGLHAAWKEEAEAYKARAERLDEEVAKLVDEVRALRSENRELRDQIAELLSR